jgi:hypothetical protein
MRRILIPLALKGEWQRCEGHRQYDGHPGLDDSRKMIDPGYRLEE